jgi:NAD(P)-dependent dehydrogenase (short-subunit alcohol dehydrogenase family)
MGQRKVDARGTVALVVGGASGMGRLAAQRWVRDGGVSVAADIDDDGLRATAAGHDRLHTLHVDVTDAAAVDVLVKDVEVEHGPIARVYNAAAIQPTSLLLGQDLEEIHRVMQINYGGLVNVSLAAMPRLLARGSGSLVNFCSIAGWVPNMHFGAYCASKFAAVAFTEILYHENRGKGVHIACVCPSQVDTPLRAQARSKPKIMETGPKAMRPEAVLDAIDRAVAKQRFWVYPGLHTAIGVRIRRFLPALLWKIDHDAEGF